MTPTETVLRFCTGTELSPLLKGIYKIESEISEVSTDMGNRPPQTLFEFTEVIALTEKWIKFHFVLSSVSGKTKLLQ